MKLKQLILILSSLFITVQADAQLRGLLNRARQIGNQATGGAVEAVISSSEKKKAAKEYQTLCEAANKAIENHDLRYFCATNRRNELGSTAFKAEIDNSDMDYRIQKFLSEETDLNNTDYIASARGLLARSKAEEDIPTSNYLLKCAKIQYTTELEKVNPETLPILQDLYNEIIAYENTFTNGRNKGTEIIEPSKIEEVLAARKAEEEAAKYEAMEWNNIKNSENTSPSSIEAEEEKKLPGEYPDFYNNSHEWKDKENKVIASVNSDGTIYRGSQYGGGTKICQIKKNGEIWVSGELWGQVMKNSYYYIYKYDRYSKEYKEMGTVSPYSNGRVEWEHQYMGNADRIIDKNGNELVPHDRGNTTFVHRAVAFFLYEKFRR